MSESNHLPRRLTYEERANLRVSRSYLVRAADLPGADPSADPLLGCRLAFVQLHCPECGASHAHKLDPWKEPWDVLDHQHNGTPQWESFYCPETGGPVLLRDCDEARSKKLWRQMEGAREAIALKGLRGVR